MTSRVTRIGLAIWFGLVIVFLLFPLLFLGPLSLNASEILSFPPQQWSLRWYRALFTDPSWSGALWLSFKVAILVTVISVAVGTAAALAIVRHRVRGSAWLYGLSIAPLIVPGIVIALGMFMVFARLKWLESLPALVLAHSVVAVPYVVVVVSAALRNLDETVERAARVLGAGPWQTFHLVTVPALRSSILAGGMFAFFASFDDLIITLFVSGALETLPLRIWNDLNLRLDPTVAAAACVMVAMSMAGLGIAEFARKANLRRLQTEPDHG
ncbi:ABC-type spermidine/putrescine transport system, permease component I [Bosea sp. LC85]|uniref:ABC transporter permease n=1 Tax=Bosea sp. LC85 TaxID=1502851 RepID=UPI0004E31F89|nr:ABC transporter permease [Bosea sp. LC85]KFC66072.1 ABC-type spermidine/putrescine transport system, permease component I [Bosea sp. LC85]